MICQGLIYSLICPKIAALPKNLKENEIPTFSLNLTHVFAISICCKDFNFATKLYFQLKTIFFSKPIQYFSVDREEKKKNKILFEMKALTPRYSEENFTRLLDRCISNAFVKTTGGLVVGLLLSTTFLRRQRWPILLGTGFGMGSAYAECDKEIKVLTDTRGFQEDT